MLDREHNSGERTNESVPERTSHVAELLNDVATLAELQWQLFAADLRRAEKVVGLKIAALTFGVLLALSCLPLALVTVALCLVEYAGWGYTRSFAVTLLLAFVLAAGTIGVSVWRFGTLSGLFQRSLMEGRMNLRWLSAKVSRLRHPLIAAASIWGRPNARHESTAPPDQTR
jgi:hypothetical protein